MEGGITPHTPLLGGSRGFLGKRPAIWQWALHCNPDQHSGARKQLGPERVLLVPNTVRKFSLCLALALSHSLSLSALQFGRNSLVLTIFEGKVKCLRGDLTFPFPAEPLHTCERLGLQVCVHL